MYISYTYVDATTGIPVTVEVAKHGPVNPAIPDLVFGFALESQYPTEKPIFYGTCRDGVSGDTPGILKVLTEAEYQAARATEINIQVTQARAAKYDELKERRKLSEQTGVTFTSLGDTTFPQPISIPAEKDDQDRIGNALSGMERWPDISVINFKAANNTFISINYDQLKKIGFAVAMLSQAAFTNEGNHTAVISRLTTVDQIKAHDVNTGWPN